VPRRPGDILHQIELSRTRTTCARGSGPALPRSLL
jgi:hypothetical protein